MSRSGVMFLTRQIRSEAWDDPMTLRNFGLSFSRQDARLDAGISSRPRHAVGISFVLVLVLLAALWAML